MHLMACPLQFLGLMNPSWNPKSNFVVRCSSWDTTNPLDKLNCVRFLLDAIYFFDMSVFLETGELNTYVNDSGGFNRRNYVLARRHGEKSDDHCRRPNAYPVPSCAGITEALERTARHSLPPIDRLAVEASVPLWFRDVVRLL